MVEYLGVDKTLWTNGTINAPRLTSVEVIETRKIDIEIFNAAKPQPLFVDFQA